MGSFNILITEADRKHIQKFAALAFHPSTPAPEAEAARLRYAELLKKNKLKYGDGPALLAEWKAEDDHAAE